MKLRGLFSMMLAGASLGMLAQTHAEGVDYYKADQFENAKELLERNFNNPGTDKAVADYYLGLIAVENGDLNAAARYFSEGMTANPEYAYNYVGEGSLCLKRGELKNAEKLFKDGEKYAKKDASFQIAVARAYYDADPVANEKEITKRLEKARKINMSNPDIYLFEGDMRKDRKDIGGAASMYEMAKNYDAQSAAAYVKYANLFSMVNPDNSIRLLKELLATVPTSALGQRELANAYYNKQAYQEAAREYGKYVKNPSHFKQDEDRYAFLLFYGGDYKGGYDYSTALLAKNPDNFTAQRYQFMNAAQLPEMKEQLLPMAEKLLSAKRAKKANKFAPIDYTLIAQELEFAKRSDEAVQVIKEGMAEYPDNANFDKMLAMAYVEQNQLANASDAYEGYLKKVEEPGYNDFIQQATFAYYAGIENRDNPQKADSYFELTKNMADKAASILPNNYKPKKFLGDIAKAKATDKAGVQSAAQPFYEEAIVLLEGSDNPSRYATDAKDMYNYLGNYYLDHKNVAKAKEYFNKYLQYDPNNAEYRKFVESLK